MNKRDEYVENLKTQLDQWNADITRWEAKAQEAQASAKVEYEKRLEQLRQNREQVMYQMTLMQAAAGNAWMELVKGADEALARMRDAFDKASAQFRPK